MAGGDSWRCVMLSCGFCSLPFWKRKAPSLGSLLKKEAWELELLGLKEEGARGLNSRS